MSIICDLNEKSIIMNERARPTVFFLNWKYTKFEIVKFDTIESRYFKLFSLKSCRSGDRGIDNRVLLFKKKIPP